MQRGTSRVRAEGYSSIGVLANLLRYAQARGKGEH